ncbi:fimbria/pilus outer membrane usher protein, partial [Escherichia coli]|nr:fimbria/pilus outer membrane usher protein [Escherichia coli]
GRRQLKMCKRNRLSTNMNGNNQYKRSSSGYSNKNRVSYSVNGGYGMKKPGKDLTNLGGYASYEPPGGTLAGSVSDTSDNNRQYSVNTDGGFVLH